MLEAAHGGDKTDKETFERRAAELRVDLVNLQYDLRDAGFAVLVFIAGDDRLGIADLLTRLNDWMDARYLRTHVFRTPSDEEAQRPWAWRLWKAMPAAGEIAAFAGATTPATIRAHLDGEIDRAEFDRRSENHRRLTETLTADRTLVLRIWLHLPKDAARKRLKKARDDPSMRWRVDRRDSRFVEEFDRALPIVERYLRISANATAPWTVVDGTHPRSRDLAVAELVVNTVRDRLDLERSSGARAGDAAVSADPRDTDPRDADGAGASTPVVSRSTPAGQGILDRVDLSLCLDYDTYRERIDELQARLYRLSLDALDAGLTTVLVFEGWDAAGKGGAIRRVTHALEPGEYRVVPVAAPSPEELAHHYLWRFWRPLPRAGRVLVFDRSWYGRVLVERVEGLALPGEWLRAYDEVNDFEDQLVRHGIVLRKFWLHLSEEEQLRRFEAREKTAYKKYKITAEDYRNREKRGPYREAVEEMFARTSTDLAPWTVVPAEDKRWARVQVLKDVCDALAAGLAHR